METHIATSSPLAALDLNVETIPSLREVYAFLRKHYRADRFTERDTPAWGTDYSHNLARSRLDDLREKGSPSYRTMTARAAAPFTSTGG